MESLFEDQAPGLPGRPARPFTESGVLWVPSRQLAIEFGISRRTLSRWLRNAAIALPPPHRVNGRLYFERVAIDAWKTAIAVKAAARVAAE